MTDQRFDSTTTTTCGYCGVGCRLEAHVHGDRVLSISPAVDGSANVGHTCLKGRFVHQFSRSRERLTTPLNETIAQVTDRIEPGHVFTAFHFPEVRTNLLVGSCADVNTSCPEYEIVAVDVRPIPEAAARTPALAAH